MGITECVKCHKKLELKKECDEAGTAYHSRCFACYVCHRFLTEYDVYIRYGHLYCKKHAVLIGGFPPLCKVYFNDSATCYRIICAEDKGVPSRKKRRKKEREAEERHKEDATTTYSKYLISIAKKNARDERRRKREEDRKRKEAEDRKRKRQEEQEKKAAAAA